MLLIIKSIFFIFKITFLTFQIFYIQNNKQNCEMLQENLIKDGLFFT